MANEEPENSDQMSVASEEPEASDQMSVASEEPEACDQMSVVSDASEMEPFEDYKPKLEKLLEDLKLPECSIESLQHGYNFQNCVYALTSLTDPSDQYIVRVPGFDGEVNERCSEIDDGVCVLKYLKDKLPVPEIKNFSATPDNSIEKPYTIQTKLAGQSLNHVYSSLDPAERRAMIDQYIDLLAKMESIRLPTAGSLVAPFPLPADAQGAAIPAPSVNVFNEYDPDPIEDPQILADRAGSSIKLLFKSLITKYIATELQSEADGYNAYVLPHWRRMETMLDEMEQEGYFRTTPEPIVMHHWDLEARNIMVAKNTTTTGEWTITGLIDWDEAICLPRPLARKPPAWFWTWSDSDEDTSSEESDCDQYPDRELSEEEAALKAYFDRKVEERLPGYLEDAYRSGRLLRRLWVYIKDGLSKQWTIEPCEQLLAEWESTRRGVSPPPEEELEPQDPPVSENLVSSEQQPRLETCTPERSDDGTFSFSAAVMTGWTKTLAWISMRLQGPPS